MTGYINNSYQQYGPQFAGIPTPQNMQIPPQEPSLMETIMSPASLIFAPMTAMDHNVKKYIKQAATNNGVAITRDAQKSIFGFKYSPKYTPIAGFAQQATIGQQLKGVDYKEIFKSSVIDPRREELYRSLAKEGKTAQQIQAIAGEGHELAKVEKAIEGVKAGNKTMNGIRSAMGVGKVAKFCRSIPLLSTALFSIGEVFEIGAATKYGAGETTKQIARSGVTVAANIVGFEAGTSAGAAIGATIGSIVPGAGTVVGGVIGGFLGGMVASHFAGKATSFLCDSFLGKAKHKEAAEQQAVAQTQPQQVQAQTAPQQAQTKGFGTYSMPQGYTPALANNGISLGDENMMSNAMSTYRLSSMAA